MADTSKPLSGSQLQKLFKNKVKIVSYSELSKYNDINELLNPFGYFILLYETNTVNGVVNGHWTCVLKTVRDSIEAFDSYGVFKPDDELNLIDQGYRMENNEVYPHLSYLLYHSGKPIEYNDYPLQEFRKNINTCGYHCVVRLANRHLTIEQYVRELRKLSKVTCKSIDQLVVELTK